MIVPLDNRKRGGTGKWPDSFRFSDTQESGEYEESENAWMKKQRGSPPHNNAYFNATTV